MSSRQGLIKCICLLDKREIGVIKSIALFITLRCNLRCQHCLSGCPKEDSDFPIGLLHPLLEQARLFGANHVCLTGGEPGLHPQIETLIEVLVNEGYTWNFVTNGWDIALYEPLITRFKDTLKSVTVSIDGAVPETHDDLRRKKGSLNHAIEAVRFYTSRGITVHISTCLSQKNKNEISSIVQKAVKLGANQFNISSLIPNNENRHLLLTDTEKNSFIQQVSEWAPKPDVKIFLRSGLQTQGGIHFCPCLNLTKIHINSRGELVFCCDIEDNKAVIGSLRDRPLVELITGWLEASSKMQSQRASQIASGEMGEGFDTCAYCGDYFNNRQT